MDGKRDVICVEAKKVFDSCIQEHHVERMFPATGISDHTKVEVECRIDTHNISCKEVSPREPVDRRKHKALVCLAITVPVTLRLINRATGKIIRTLEKTVVVLKQVVLCVPPGAEVKCEVTGDCCCVFDKDNEEINCVFDFCIAIKSTGTVQVLVPTLGVCSSRECQHTRRDCRKEFDLDDCDCDD